MTVPCPVGQPTVNALVGCFELQTGHTVQPLTCSLSLRSRLRLPTATRLQRGTWDRGTRPPSPKEQVPVLWQKANEFNKISLQERPNFVQNLPQLHHSCYSSVKLNVNYFSTENAISPTNWLSTHCMLKGAVSRKKKSRNFHQTE